MRLIFFIAALISVSVLAVTYKYNHHNSDPVPVVEPVIQPEQLHYVIYFFVCGKLEGVLVVGDPRPRWANDHAAASTRMLELMLDSEKEGRATNIRHWHRGCPREKI